MTETPEPATDDRKPAPKMRQFVMSEIRRLAAENGGRAPGSERFNRLTHLSHSYWKGEIWLRWSDAVREAGLKPNTKNPRLSDEVLLSEFAVLTANLGRVPTNPEMRQYRKSGGRIAAENTYWKHFGRKIDLLRRLKLWAEESPERAHVAKLLPDAPDDEPELPRDSGAVYLLRWGQIFKIGCSRNPDHRTTVIARGMPRSTRLVHVIATDDPYGVEAYWHRRFADRRIGGEWFRLSADEVAAFRARKTQ